MLLMPLQVLQTPRMKACFSVQPLECFIAALAFLRNKSLVSVTMHFCACALLCLLRNCCKQLQMLHMPLDLVLSVCLTLNLVLHCNM